MSSSIRPSVDALVRLVEAGRFIEAIETWYAEDASTQEPGEVPPTVGKPALLAKERTFLTTVVAWHVLRAEAVLVDGTAVAIHWRFEVTRAPGERVVLEEVALQQWRGEDAAARLVREQYFPFRAVGG